jgi:hypothetical protein
MDHFDSNLSFIKTLGKLTLSSYKKPEPLAGPDAISFILNLIRDERGHLGFFFIYELMTNTLSMSIIPGDSSHSVGSVLLHFLSDDLISGLLGSILRVMESHVELCSQFPVFEDNRRLKINLSLTGLDIFQTHVKNAAAFIKATQPELNISRLSVSIPSPFQPISVLQATPTADQSNGYKEGRMWLNPIVLDFNCEKRMLSHSSIPSFLTKFSTVFTATTISQLLGSPLEAITLSDYVSLQNLQSRGQQQIDNRSPLRVLNHPSSRSHIARTTVERMEKDIADFAVDENNTSIPVLLYTNNSSNLEGSGLQQSINETEGLISKLESLRSNDHNNVKEGMVELLNFVNGLTGSNSSRCHTFAHRLLQYTGNEAVVEFEFLASCIASSNGNSNICQYNNFLNAIEGEVIYACTMLLLTSSNRINHAILALSQARSLLKLLKSLQNDTKNSITYTRTVRELTCLSENFAATLSNKRHYAKETTSGLYELDPRYLLFEFCHGMILRKSQVELVHKLMNEMHQGNSVVNQMIMGAGKTTVVGPLLAMLLANSRTLMVEVVPPALLDFSAGVLRERFSAAIKKPIFTFVFDRYTHVTPQLLFKLLTARNQRAVVVSTPASVKSFMLKFIEICHNLNRQKNMVAEENELQANVNTWSISHLLGIGSRKNFSGFKLRPEEIKSIKTQATLCSQIFGVLRNSIEIMDEVDIILHPLKSELNWPLGVKDPLGIVINLYIISLSIIQIILTFLIISLYISIDFTRSKTGNGLRWQIASHLLDAIFSCCGIPIVADIADSKLAKKILGDLDTSITLGFNTLQLQKSPHLALVSKNFYDMNLKKTLGEWLLIWLRARKLPCLIDSEIMDFLLNGSHCKPEVAVKISKNLGDDHVKMLNLGFDWLSSYLPFVLQKINRVHFGLLQEYDIKQLEDDGVKIPATRTLVAVPFVAKDVPSRASEFAHPDILIGLTILAFRYEGLREKDFYITLKYLKENLDQEGGPYKDRPSYQRFESWILSAGKNIRGSKKREKGTRRSVHSDDNALKDALGNIKVTQSTIVRKKTSLSNERKKINVFSDIFADDDNLIWPLQLVEAKDKEQFRVLYPLLTKLPHAVMFYLNDLIFPEVLATQGLKLSACGQELGGDMIFGRRIGFSGTHTLLSLYIYIYIDLIIYLSIYRYTK